MTEIIDATATAAGETPRRGQRGLGGRRGSGRPPTSERGTTRGLAIGGPPRVDLLPGEVHSNRQQRRVVRRLWVGVVVVALGVAILAGWATMVRMSAEQELLSAQGETSALAQQQGQFRDVRIAESQTALLEAAQRVGGSTELDWSATLESVRSKLPQGVQITGVTIDSASATSEYAQSDDPLQGRRVATLTFDAKSAVLPSIPDWLTAVSGVTGYVDANANSVARSDDGSGYTVNMTIHLDERAFDGKYAAEGTKG